MTDDLSASRREAQQRALQKELERTRRELQPLDPEHFARELREFERQACALADRLAPAIRSCILEGFVGELGGEYAKAVRRRFSEWLQGPGPDTLSLSGRVAAAAHQQLKASQCRGLVGEANKAIDAQAWDEAVLLAQLLLSNWNGILEHARQDGRQGMIDAIFQTQFHPLPMGALVGARLYRIPLKDTCEIFTSYLKATYAASSSQHAIGSLPVDSEGTNTRKTT